MTLPTSTSATEAEQPRLGELAPGLVVVGVMLAVMWGGEIIDLLPGTPFNGWGIRPRSTRGLLGIVFAPFLHVGFAHLISNTIPFAVLGGLIALGGARQFVAVTVAVGVVSGLGVWVLGASRSVHLGASGLVFGYITYLVSRGLFARRVLWILGGAVVAVIYGGSLLLGLIPNGRMSWQGHLFGAIGGVVAAYLLHAQPDDDEDAV